MARVSTETLQRTKSFRKPEVSLKADTVPTRTDTHGTDRSSVSLLASSLPGCLRTLVTESALAGLGEARNDEACLSGDKKGPSYTR